MSLNLYDDCIFIADSHYNEKNTVLLSFLKHIKDKKLETKQLVLMGDMFDFLTYQTKYFIKKNQEVISLLNDLSKTIEIVYFEGNHDYNIAKVFPLIKVYTRQEQPVLVKYDNTSLQLAHGDIFVDKFYDVYCSLIRNKIFLKLLTFLDVNDTLSKKIYTSLMAKKICRKIPNFKAVIEKKIASYSADIVVEGHYHQGDFMQYDERLYINIPSLLCSQEYVVLNKNFKKIPFKDK